MREFAYPARFAPDKKDGGYVVSFRDISEAITQGETADECREEAAGALQAALEGRIMSNLDIPKASKPKRGEYLIAVPVCRSGADGPQGRALSGDAAHRYYPGRIGAPPAD